MAHPLTVDCVRFSPQRASSGTVTVSGTADVINPPGDTYWFSIHLKVNGTTVATRDNKGVGGNTVTTESLSASLTVGQAPLRSGSNAISMTISNVRQVSFGAPEETPDEGERVSRAFAGF
mgnify:CR=1 FL=1